MTRHRAERFARRAFYRVDANRRAAQVSQALGPDRARHTRGATVRVRSGLWNAYAFGGSKSLVLSTTSFLGGKDAFLGAAYLAVGTSCALASAVFLYFHFKPPRRVGDMSECPWQKTSGVSAGQRVLILIFNLRYLGNVNIIIS